MQGGGQIELKSAEIDKKTKVSLWKTIRQLKEPVDELEVIGKRFFLNSKARDKWEKTRDYIRKRSEYLEKRARNILYLKITKMDLSP